MSDYENLVMTRETFCLSCAEKKLDDVHDEQDAVIFRFCKLYIIIIFVL